MHKLQICKSHFFNINNRDEKIDHYKFLFTNYIIYIMKNNIYVK